MTIYTSCRLIIIKLLRLCKTELQMEMGASSFPKPKLYVLMSYSSRHQQRSFNCIGAGSVCANFGMISCQNSNCTTPALTQWINLVYINPQCFRHFGKQQHLVSNYSLQHILYAAVYLHHFVNGRIRYWRAFQRTKCELYLLAFSI